MEAPTAHIIPVDFLAEQQSRHDIARAEALDAEELQELDGDLDIWQCACGSVLWHIAPFGIVCAACDKEQPYPY
jgi:hypothetical protein